MNIKRAKICLIGDGAVGKTSLVQKFVLDKFDDSYITTIGTKVMKKDVEVSDTRVTMMLWDILGQKDYNRLQSSSFVGSQGAILVLDRTRRETLDSLSQYWSPRFKEVIPLGFLVIAANKNDLVEQFQLSQSEIESFAKELDAPYFLSSAKTGENVEKMFSSMAQMCLQERDIVSFTPKDRGISNLLEATDAVIDDFCKGLKDQDDAMPYVRQQCKITKLDIKSPDTISLLKFIDALHEIDKMFLTSSEASQNRIRRQGYVKKGEGKTS
ncbi:MAG TPA: GTP-binding protein [Euryarchaeota archaeon]|nr:GTP-binding protein [Euryarchaeota archaeon]